MTTDAMTMSIEEFTSKYTTIYMFVFEGKVMEIEEKEERSVITKISEFLFEPRYEVNKLNFKLIS